MAQVLFYTKPGCVTGGKQFRILEASGHDVEVRSILDHPWTAATLRPFFGSRPVAEWFNPNAPRVKSGEVNPASFTEETAIAAMLEEHLLIRRPLIAVGEKITCGFDTDLLQKWIGIDTDSATREGDLNACSSTKKDTP